MYKAHQFGGGYSIEERELFSKLVVLKDIAKLRRLSIFERATKRYTYTNSFSSTSKNKVLFLLTAIFIIPHIFVVYFGTSSSDLKLAENTLLHCKIFEGKFELCLISFLDGTKHKLFVFLLQ